MKKILFVLPICFVLFAGCDKDNENPPAATAELFGTVTLYDDRTTPVSPAGMVVSVDGLSLSATTDASGRYSFPSLPKDVYNLTFNKAGFGTFRLFGVNHNPTGTSTQVGGRTLGQISTTTVTGLTVTPVGADTVSLSVAISPAGSASASRGVRFFFHSAGSVSASNYTGFSPVYTIRSGTGNVLIAKAALQAMGFSSGATVHVIAYGDAYFSNDYDDPATGKTVFPNINGTTVTAVSFTL